MTNEELRNWSARKMGAEESVITWFFYGKSIDKKDWQPDDPSTGQIWMLVERMRESGWWLIFDGGRCGPYYAEFRSSGNKRLGYQRDLNPCLAILKAARATES